MASAILVVRADSTAMALLVLYLPARPGSGPRQPCCRVALTVHQQAGFAAGEAGTQDSPGDTAAVARIQQRLATLS